MVLTFEPGFNVISGETGSGKSLVLNAIRFALGERLSPSPLGPFGPSTSVLMKLRLHQQDLSILRETFYDGKSSLSCNGKRMTPKALKHYLKDTFEIMKQHDQLTYNDHQTLSHLDLFGQIDTSEYESHYQNYLRKVRDYKRFKEQYHSTQVLGARLAQLPELRLLNPSLEDYEMIETQLKDLDMKVSQHEILESLQTQFQTPSFKTTLTKLQTLFNQLDDDDLNHQFHDAHANLLDLSDTMNSRTFSMTQSTHETQLLEARLQAYHVYIKRFGSLQSLVKEYDLLKIQDECALDFDEQCNTYETHIKKMLMTLEDTAAQLSIHRSQLIKPFGDQVQSHLESMLLKDVCFDIEQTTGTLHSKGWDHFNFKVNINQHDQLSDFATTASGGEKSRFQLAISMTLAKVKQSSIYLFDEIDTGVSGQVASAMGWTLKNLSQHAQVIAITHQAPVASYADQHMYVFKKGHKGGIMSQAKTLLKNERPIELAMMMSGHQSDESLMLANQLLAKGAQ